MAILFNNEEYLASICFMFNIPVEDAEILNRGLSHKALLIVQPEREMPW